MLCPMNRHAVVCQIDTRRVRPDQLAAKGVIIINSAAQISLQGVGNKCNYKRHHLQMNGSAAVNRLTRLALASLAAAFNA